MKHITLSSLLLLGASLSLHGQISLTESGYTQQFNSSPTFSLDYGSGTHTWTDNATIEGWYAETVSPNNGNYRATNGNRQYPTKVDPNTSLFAFRETNTDGALGSIADETHHAVFGAYFVNNTGSTITALDISYVGEQWAWNNSSTLNTLDFAYSTNATNLSDGAWTDVSNLSFTALYADGPSDGQALDGNGDEIFDSGYRAKTAGEAGGPGAANYENISAVISGLSIADGESFWIRWTDDFDGTGVGQGIAVDNLSITAIPEPSSVALGLAGFGAALMVYLRKRLRK